MKKNKSSSLNFKKNYEFVRFSKKYAITGVAINKTNPRIITPQVPKDV
tara:strand:- start:127 stop:270 length:144 start_codon:yes stop_codon:yes gene_type:complete